MDWHSHPLNLENAAAQRQLTEDGRAQARALGKALRDLKIPFPLSLLVSSAEQLKLQRSYFGEVIPSMDVTEGGLVASPNENKRRVKALSQLLSTAPSKGSNAIIVSHRPDLQDAAGKDFGDLIEAEVAVSRPLGDGKFELVACVAPVTK